MTTQDSRNTLRNLLTKSDFGEPAPQPETLLAESIGLWEPDQPLRFATTATPTTANGKTRTTATIYPTSSEPDLLATSENSPSLPRLWSAHRTAGISTGTYARNKDRPGWWIDEGPLWVRKRNYSVNRATVSDRPAVHLSLSAEPKHSAFSNRQSFTPCTAGDGQLCLDLRHPNW